MRLDEVRDRELALAALKDEIREITAIVRHMRQKRAMRDVMKAEKRLIKAQVDARLLRLPMKVLGAGQALCKGEREPYSLIKPQPPQRCNGKMMRTAH